MTDYTELKRLLEGCKESSCADASDFGRRISDLYDYLDPETVAEMVAENERLNAENKQLILLECHGGTAQAAINLLAERDQLKAELEKAELIGRIACNFDGYKAVLDERDQLKAEVEALRQDAERYRRMRTAALKQDDVLADEFDAEFDLQLDAALGKEAQS